MTQYVETTEISNMKRNIILLKWKKYTSDKQKQRQRNIILAKLSKKLINKQKSENHNSKSYVAFLNCDLDIAPYLNCS